MSLCESIFDCNQKSLEQMIKMNQAVNQLQHKIDDISKTNQHGFIYYLMSEIAIIYVLYLLRNYLTVRTIVRCITGFSSLYQRLSFRTINISNRSRSNRQHDSVELGSVSIVTTESEVNYGSIEVNQQDAVIINMMPTQPSLSSSELSEVSVFENPNTQELDIPDSQNLPTTDLTGNPSIIELTGTYAKRPNADSAERTIEPSETARTPGSVFTV